MLTGAFPASFQQPPAARKSSSATFVQTSAPAARVSSIDHEKLAQLCPLASFVHYGVGLGRAVPLVFSGTDAVQHNAYEAYILLDWGVAITTQLLPTTDTLYARDITTMAVRYGRCCEALQPLFGRDGATPLKHIFSSPSSLFAAVRESVRLTRGPRVVDGDATARELLPPEVLAIKRQLAALPAGATSVSDPVKKATIANLNAARHEVRYDGASYLMTFDPVVSINGTDFVRTKPLLPGCESLSFDETIHQLLNAGVLLYLENPAPELPAEMRVALKEWHRNVHMFSFKHRPTAVNPNRAVAVNGAVVLAGAVQRRAKVAGPAAPKKRARDSDSDEDFEVASGTVRAQAEAAFQSTLAREFRAPKRRTVPEAMRLSVGAACAHPRELVDEAAARCDVQRAVAAFVVPRVAPRGPLIAVPIATIDVRGLQLLRAARAATQPVTMLERLLAKQAKLCRAIDANFADAADAVLEFVQGDVPTLTWHTLADPDVFAHFAHGANYELAQLLLRGGAQRPNSEYKDGDPVEVVDPLEPHVTIAAERFVAPKTSEFKTMYGALSKHPVACGEIIGYYRCAFVPGGDAEIDGREAVQMCAGVERRDAIDPFGVGKVCRVDTDNVRHVGSVSAIDCPDSALARANHSSTPNAEFIYDYDDLFGGIPVKAIKDIAAGEFVHIDYGADYIADLALYVPIMHPFGPAVLDLPQSPVREPAKLLPLSAFALSDLSSGFATPGFGDADEEALFAQLTVQAATIATQVDDWVQ